MSDTSKRLRIPFSETRFFLEGEICFSTDNFKSDISSSMISILWKTSAVVFGVLIFILISLVMKKRLFCLQGYQKVGGESMKAGDWMRHLTVFKNQIKLSFSQINFVSKPFYWNVSWFPPYNYDTIANKKGLVD